jgi:hypothetical protein
MKERQALGPLYGSKRWNSGTEVSSRYNDYRRERLRLRPIGRIASLEMTGAQATKSDVMKINTSLQSHSITRPPDNTEYQDLKI